jgi:hypothetical protein
MALLNSSPTLLPQDLGIAPYLLQHVSVGLAENDPSAKITPTGFLKALVENTPDFGMEQYDMDKQLSLMNKQGQYRNIKLWYYQRRNPANVATSLDCVSGAITDRSTFDLSAPFVASETLFMSNSDLMQYQEDAIKTVKLGKAPTPFMEELFKQIMLCCNSIAGKMDLDLLGAVTFGTNAVNGSYVGTNPKPLDINKDATQFDMTKGIPALLTDAELNEFVGEPLIVGAGLMLAYDNFKKSAGAALNGLNIAQQGPYKFYKDFYAKSSSAWGSNANNIGVFAKGTVGVIDLNTLVGFREQNLSTFQAFQIPLPIYNEDGTATIMMFDVRMRFQNCPSDVADAAYGGTRTVSEGWTIQISKQYGLFQTPASLYTSGDVLEGSNGALLYQLANT